ncbi:hypothetical protein CMV_000813 [Castanea mollissima]|uniref:Uncharacterized protein n=1 Tax=Castanea mollissima TaxID=60419 RepID=A0A8J4RYY4_9ROSI|nr:hypothetical protein CMV_000813 [Castanea mollissima]
MLAVSNILFFMAIIFRLPLRSKVVFSTQHCQIMELWFIIYSGTMMECEFSQGKKSSEEEVELQRSTKKAKDAKGASEFGSPPSYRDKLVGEMSSAFV